MMKKKARQTEDVEYNERTSQTSYEDQTKSFMIGGGKRFLNISIPQLKLIGKQSYKKQPYCVICFRNFTGLFRQHHCRVCANAVCNDCSKSMINKQRACDLCIYQTSNPQQQKKKKETLETLQTLCAYLVYRRNLKQTELQTLKLNSGQNNEEVLKEIANQQKQIKEMQHQNQKLKEQKELLDIKLEKVRETNAEIQSSIEDIEKELGDN